MVYIEHVTSPDYKPSIFVSRLVRCDSGRCSGLNEIKNILNAGQHFMSIFLPHGTPTLLRPLVNEIVSAHKSATLRTDELLRLMRRLIDEFSNGNYLQRNSSEPVQLGELDEIVLSNTSDILFGDIL